MKQTDKKSPNNNQLKRSARSGSKGNKLQQSNSKGVGAKGTDLTVLSAEGGSDILVTNSNAGLETSEVYDVIVHCMDDTNRSEASKELKPLAMMDKVYKDKLESSKNLLMEAQDEKEEESEESDSETVSDSVTFNGDIQTAEDERFERTSKVPQWEVKKASSDSLKSEQGIRNMQLKVFDKTQKTTPPTKGTSSATAKNLSENNSKKMKVHPKPSSESSEGDDDRVLDKSKDVDALDETSNETQTDVSDEDMIKVDENYEKEERVALDRKIEEMETKIEILEEELREVAALEISLYSVVPEHGSSAHKVHTSARRLSRLYIYACKHFSQDKRATVARNTVSGLVLVAKSCGNDVPRLTFWWSNAIVLREIIVQAFGSSCQSSSITTILESIGGKRSEGKSPSLKWKTNCSSKQPNKLGLMDFGDDWQETRTFTSALEKVESWIFSRIVESIWWQTLTPNMQSLASDTNTNKTIGKLLGPALGDQQQGSFSVNLWKIAFHDAFKGLCPVRAGGHECGCLPVLAGMVMEQCIARLDVAMFNAILRESAHEIPTDPVSDPIVDSKVLPIPAGDLSFGSGAQLKNSVGNWSRWLSDFFGMDADDSAKEGHHTGENDEERNSKSKCFHLLNELSDLLMLPKDMLADRSIRSEVCPSISLPLLKRILCNFTPDEFCPDPVPGAVLEGLNAESIVERRLSGEAFGSFPYPAAPVRYKPPSSADVSSKVAEVGWNSQLARSASAIQRKGYTSDEELKDLDSPLTSIIEKLPSPTVSKNVEHSANLRYDLLCEVWLS